MHAFKIPRMHKPKEVLGSSHNHLIATDQFRKIASHKYVGNFTRYRLLVMVSDQCYCARVTGYLYTPSLKIEVGRQSLDRNMAISL